MWSISVRTESLIGFSSSRAAAGELLVTTEHGDLREQTLAHLGIGHAEALLGCEHQHPELALVQVLVHLERGLRGVLEGEHRRERRVDLALADQPVGLPRLAVIREVTALERLLV